MTQISGSTRIFGIIADPVAQVKTPQGINRIARERGVDSVMVPLHVASDGLAAAFAGLRTIKNFGGMIVTVPHKEAAVNLCDDVSARGRLVGAINAVRREPDGRLLGDIFDGIGFVTGLERNGVSLRGSRVYLAGAGGAAKAIAFALAEANVTAITIFNRSAEKAEALARRLREQRPDLITRVGSPDPAGHDLIVNGTSLGLKTDDPLPFDATRLTAEMTVAEIIMEPEVTPLLAAARQRGSRIHFGRPMLESQLDLMASFMGVTAPAAA
jgi:shikimate dehydrogenase